MDKTSDYSLTKSSFTPQDNNDSPLKVSTKSFFHLPIVENFIVAAAYFVTGWLGLMIAIPPGVATPVWAPSGIALAAVLMMGKRVLPGIAIGSFLVNFITLAGSNPLSGTIAISLAISAGSALQAFTGSVVIHKFIGVSNPFYRVQDVYKFTWLEFVVCMISPSFGAAALLFAEQIDWSQIHYVWLTWWTGDLVGVLAATPLLMVWSRPLRKKTQMGWFEILIYSVWLVIMCYAVFGGTFEAPIRHYLLPYVLLPFVVWAAFWFGVHGVTFSATLISLAAIGGTFHGYGPFAQSSLNESFLRLQPFIAILTVTGLVFSAALHERKHAHEELQRNQKDLKDFVENAAVGMNWVGPNGIIIWANRAELDLLGYSMQEYIGHSILEFHADRAVSEEMLERLRNHEQLKNYEAQLRCKDGSIRHVLISANVLWENGSFVHTRCFTQDITDRKYAQQELVNAHAQLEQRVVDRTLELSQAYKALEGEMAERLQAQKDILHISEREQKRIGQDLHDGLAQQLAGISFMSKTLQYKLNGKAVEEAADLDEILAIIKKTIEDTRRLSRGFYPVELEKLGLIPALEELAADMEKMFSVPCFYQFDPSIMIADETTAGHVYRMMQEALSNAVKHGKPKRVNISFKRTGQQAALIIDDDGIGINKENMKGRMGLRIMSYRAKMIGASFDIDNRPEGGTRVSFKFKI